MKSPRTKIPLSVLAQTFGIAIAGGIPVLFIAFSQIRRACGDRLFGSREHFCSAHETWTWFLSLPGWSYWILAVVAGTGIAIMRWFLRKIAS